MTNLQKFMEERFWTREFLLAAFVQVTVTLLMSVSKIDGSVYQAITITVMGSFALANPAEHWVQMRRLEIEAEKEARNAQHAPSTS